MSGLSYTLRDSATMLRRDVRHSLRYLPMTEIARRKPLGFSPGG